MRLPYGTTSLKLPDRFRRGARVIRPPSPRPVGAEALRRAARSAARGAAGRVLVVVPDATRYA
ncbi:MAG: hypothetical protein ACYTAF_15810, partial [Planctomycetota bacterium]